MERPAAGGKKLQEGTVPHSSARRLRSRWAHQLTVTDMKDQLLWHMQHAYCSENLQHAAVSPVCSFPWSPPLSLWARWGFSSMAVGACVHASRLRFQQTLPVGFPEAVAEASHGRGGRASIYLCTPLLEVQPRPSWLSIIPRDGCSTLVCLPRMCIISNWPFPFVPCHTC